MSELLSLLCWRGMWPFRLEGEFRILTLELSSCDRSTSQYLNATKESGFIPLVSVTPFSHDDINEIARNNPEFVILLYPQRPFLGDQLTCGLYL